MYGQLAKHMKTPCGCRPRKTRVKKIGTGRVERGTVSPRALCCSKTSLLTQSVMRWPVDLCLMTHGQQEHLRTPTAYWSRNVNMKKKKKKKTNATTIVISRYVVVRLRNAAQGATAVSAIYVVSQFVLYVKCWSPTNRTVQTPTSGRRHRVTRANDRWSISSLGKRRKKSGKYEPDKQANINSISWTSCNFILFMDIQQCDRKRVATLSLCKNK